MVILSHITGKEKAKKMDKSEGNVKQKDSVSSLGIGKLVPKALLHSTSMKNLFKTKKHRTPLEVVRQFRALLLYVDSGVDVGRRKREEKLDQFDVIIKEMRTILYGTDESEPVKEACMQVTQEFFSNDTFRLLISCLPQLNFEARVDAALVVANLQKQRVHSCVMASDYLEANLDLMDHLILGYEDQDMALHYGPMLRDCLRHQVVAKYVLASEKMKKFFEYAQLPYFEISSDAVATFKELMTRHKSTVAESLSANYSWFFAEFNSKFLESPNYMARRHGIKLLGDMLHDRSNSGVMIRYVSSLENMRVLMNLMKEPHKGIQIDAFHVFKLFVANQKKPADILTILLANKSKLLLFFDDFKPEKEDEIFEADKAEIVKEIMELQPASPTICTRKLLKPITA